MIQTAEQLATAALPARMPEEHMRLGGGSVLSSDAPQKWDVLEKAHPDLVSLYVVYGRLDNRQLLEAWGKAAPVERSIYRSAAAGHQALSAAAIVGLGSVVAAGISAPKHVAALGITMLLTMVAVGIYVHMKLSAHYTAEFSTDLKNQDIRRVTSALLSERGVFDVVADRAPDPAAWPVLYRELYYSDDLQVGLRRLCKTTTDAGSTSAPST